MAFGVSHTMWVSLSMVAGVAEWTMVGGSTTLPLASIGPAMVSLPNRLKEAFVAGAVKLHTSVESRLGSAQSPAKRFVKPVPMIRNRLEHPIAVPRGMTSSYFTTTARICGNKVNGVICLVRLNPNL